MKIETTLNQIPSLTWNWLKMNRGEVKIETSLADKIVFSGYIVGPLLCAMSFIYNSSD